MTRIEGPLWKFCSRALVLLLYSSQKLFRALRVLHFEYRGPCSRVRLHEAGNCTIAEAENLQLRGIVNRMLSEGPKYLNVSKHNRIVHVTVTSPPDARDGLLTSLRRMGSLARSAASCFVV